jgi:hypothetical protein
MATTGLSSGNIGKLRLRASGQQVLNFAPPGLPSSSAAASASVRAGRHRPDPAIIQQKRAEGMTPTEIARHLGCNPATVFRALRLNSPSDERHALIASAD